MAECFTKIYNKYGTLIINEWYHHSKFHSDMVGKTVGSYLACDFSQFLFPSVLVTVNSRPTEPILLLSSHTL